MNKPKPKVFLSHSHRDSQFALTVKSRLTNLGAIVLSLDEAISVGESIAGRMKSLIQEADVLLVVISPASLRSEWIHMEIGAAWALNKRVVTVLTPGVEPSDLTPPLSKLQVLRIASATELEPAIQGWLGGFIATSAGEKERTPTQDLVALSRKSDRYHTCENCVSLSRTSPDDRYEILESDAVSRKLTKCLTCSQLEARALDLRQQNKVAEAANVRQKIRPTSS